MQSKNILYFIILTVLLIGCSNTAVKTNEDAPRKLPVLSETFFQKEPGDKELFEEALVYLSNHEKEPNYMEVKARLENLVQQYPDSKWRKSAEALMLSMEKISVLQTRLKQEKLKAQADQSRLLKEIDGLKENFRQIEDRHTAEITKLQQENEQLKNDMQQLKKLEVQLEKREKMLR
jgi:hypothetical protein